MDAKNLKWASLISVLIMLILSALELSFYKNINIDVSFVVGVFVFFFMTIIYYLEKMYIFMEEDRKIK